MSCVQATLMTGGIGLGNFWQFVIFAGLMPPDTGIQVQPLLEAHLPAARVLWSAAVGVELSAGDEIHELARYLRRNPQTSFAAFGGDRLLGAVLAGHDGRRGYLYHLAVASDCRGQGIGRSLIKHSLSALKGQGIQRALILVARENQEGAAFWRRYGWEPLDFAEPWGIDL